MCGAGIDSQPTYKNAVLILKGPRLRVTTKALHFRFRRIAISRLEDARIETHFAHWPAPNKAVAVFGVLSMTTLIGGLALPGMIGLVLLIVGSLELRWAPTPFAVADLDGKPLRILKCANEGEAKLTVLAIREAKRLAAEQGT